MSLLTDLNKIDIKDLQKLDYKQVLESLRKKPEVLVIVVSVLLTLAVCFNTITQTQSQITMLNSEASVLNTKIKAIESHQTAKKDWDEFLTHVPTPITQEELINRVTDIAVKRKVEIESFTPSKEQEAPFYKLNSISLRVSAKEYSDIWLFVNDIEDSEYPIRIESWAGSMGGLTGDPSIKIQIEIASVNIKNE